MMVITIREDRSVKYWWYVRKEKLQMWFAWKLPRWLVMWATTRLVAHATTGSYSSTNVSELTVMEALKRWNAK